MCGIAGIFNLSNDRNISETTISSMIDKLSHRGPDGRGIKLDGCVGLGHARLSIIDIEGGQQPISNETKDIWVVFNGEIFNYVELTKELKKAGHTFSTHSDTEVIVHLYEEHGDEFEIAGVLLAILIATLSALNFLWEWYCARRRTKNEDR